MSDKKSIAIVGITGDPPTMGHIWLAKQAASVGFDMVWMMPCYCHKLGKKMTDAKHRLAMTEIAAREAGSNIIASDFEIFHELDGACYLTTWLLRQVFPSYDFTWVIGMDNALTLDMWMNSAVLKKGDLIPFLVCNRKGIVVPPGDHWFLSPPHRYVEGTAGVECSSRDFRNLYQQGYADCARMVSPGVLEYILEHELYKEGQQ